LVVVEGDRRLATVPCDAVVGNEAARPARR
jgi:hypothetical protein